MSHAGRPDVLFQAQIKVPCHPTKKNHYRIGRNGLYKDNRTLEYETIVMYGLNKLGEPKIDVPIHAKFIFMFPDYYTKKGLVSERLPDLSNLYEAPQDCLQRCGVIKNDRLIYSHDGSRRTSGDEYLLEICLSRFNT